MIGREELLKGRLAERVVTLAGVGDVRVRALTRAEALRLNAGTMDAVEAEAYALSSCLVEPTLTLDEALELVGGAAAGELQHLVDEIFALSGLVEGAQKRGGAGLHDEPT